MYPIVVDKESRMRRAIQRVAMTLGVLGLAFAFVLPAHADTWEVSWFLGRATLGGPLTYPFNVTTPGLPLIPSVDQSGGHCLQTTLPLPVPTLVSVLGQGVPDPGILRCHFNLGGHLRPIVNVVSNLCLTTSLNINKLAKPATHANPGCGFSIAPGKAPEGNHVHGFCGMSGGQVQLRYTDGLGQVYTLDLHFVGVVEWLLVTGHWRKLTNPVGQTGKIYALATAVPVPVTSGGGTTGNSCGGSTATLFDLAGFTLMLPHPIG